MSNSLVIVKFERETKHVRVLVECPWNRLWVYGNISTVDNFGMEIKITTEYYDPFIPVDVGLKYVQIKNKLSFTRYDKHNNKQNKYYFKQDDPKLLNYHHVAPVGTIEKYRLVKPNVHKYFVENINNVLKPNSDDNDTKENSNHREIDDTYGYKDYFGRFLIDIDANYFTKSHWLWNDDDDYHNYSYNYGMKKNEMSLLHYKMPKDSWICGIVDVGMFTNFFPNWRDDDINKHENKGGDPDLGELNKKLSKLSAIETKEKYFLPDYCRYYQIPVLIDITTLLDIEKIIPSKYRNLFKYGKNRYFTRVWIHPNDTHLYAPFGSKSSTDSQYCLLSTPALNEKGIGVASYDFIEKSRLTYQQVIDEYFINASDNELKQFQTISDFKDLKTLKSFEKYKNQRLILTDMDNEFCECILIHNKNKHDSNKYQFDQIWEARCDDERNHMVEYDENVSFIDNINTTDETLFGLSKFNPDAKSDCYRLNTTHKRPIICFDIDTFINQFYNYNEKQPYAINLIDSLWKTDIFMTQEEKDYIENIKFHRRHHSKNTLFDQNIHKDDYVFSIKCKPKNGIMLVDNEWDCKNDKWSKHLNLKYNCIAPNAFELKIKEWKTALIPVTKDYFGLNDRNDVMKLFSHWIGQIKVYIDITNEFDSFQNELKKDWLNAKEKGLIDKTQKYWNSRKYFGEFGIVMTEKPGSNAVFAERFVHLDDANEVQVYE